MDETKIDYVVVCNSNIKTSKYLKYIVKFIQYLEKSGLTLEIKHGNLKDNIYITLHLSQQVIQQFADMYYINIHNTGHTYIPVSTINLHCCQTPFTENRDIFKRRGEVTNKERILIVQEILKEAKFGEQENEYGIDKLIRLGAVKAAYPLHDGDYSDDGNDGGYPIPQNHRQILLKYWASFSLWYKEQPLNLIETYFGTEVAFYFAWLGFYNKMLIPAAIVGLICSVISIVQLLVLDHERVDDICTSKLMLCPICHSGERCVFRPLNVSCEYAKFSIVFDNHATVFFAVFMSFWATVFRNLWERRQNVLKIRWNVEFQAIDTKIRLQYKERCTHKKLSMVTGTLQAYTPRHVKVMYVTLSYITCLLLVGVVVLFVMGVILYRISMAALIRLSGSELLKIHATFLLTASSACLQVVFIKIFGRFYSQLSEWLTYLENPRTQAEFDESVILKRYFLGFVNNYASLFYIAFFKSRFFTPTHKPSMTSFVTDLCHPTGCLMSLCVQLCFLMLFKSLLGNILTLTVPMIKRIWKTKVDHKVEAQWEKEYKLLPAGRYLLTTEFMEMIIQYGFVTFFVAAFPLAPLCALINNCLELRLDAYKLVTRYRRPAPRQFSGIGVWNNIVAVITHISVATNAFVLAFTSDFVVREIYKTNHKYSLDGYINSTLSLYDMRDSHKGVRLDMVLDKATNSTLCYYKSVRHPPNHVHKYQLRPEYWYEIGMRLLCVIVFEHTILLANGILAYVIPDIPEDVRQSLHYQRTKERELKLKVQTTNTEKLRKRPRNVKINRSRTQWKTTT